jgi:hypothetical protein
VHLLLGSCQFARADFARAAACFESCLRIRRAVLHPQAQPAASLLLLLHFATAAVVCAVLIDS